MGHRIENTGRRLALGLVCIAVAACSTDSHGSASVPDPTGARDAATDARPRGAGGASPGFDAGAGGRDSGGASHVGAGGAEIRDASGDAPASDASDAAGGSGNRDAGFGLFPVDAGSITRGAVWLSLTPVTSRCEVRDVAFPWGIQKEQLSCDGDASSCPGDIPLAVNGWKETTVACSVGELNGKTTLDLRLQLSGGRFSFSAMGIIDPSLLNPVRITEYDSVTNVLRSDDQCKVTVEWNRDGTFRGTFVCSAFYDPHSAAGVDCGASGAFVFENCG